MAVTQFDTPQELLGVIFVVIAVILFLLLGISLFLSYRRSRRQSTLYISLILLFGAGALVSLVLEQIILIVSDVTQADAPTLKAFWQYSLDEISTFWIAYAFAILAWITSASAVLSGVFFTQSFFPEDSFFAKKWLLIIPTIMLILYVLTLAYAPFEWIEVAGDWQPTHEATFVLIAYILLFPNLWMIVLLFLYLTFSLFRRGTPRWKQTLVLALGQFFLSLGYTVEIVNVPDPTISLIARAVIAMYPIVMYFGFTPPNWFKRFIGV
ncbi:MAG: hypothetical protein ACFFFG_13235 [Candidatus Thorarchaeota archaeon]